MSTDTYKVLLIEDDRISQMAFERFVKEEELPYQYIIAGSISDAEDILKKDTFDVVILDYLLGDGTAFDILHLLKETPVIFATGAGNEELAVRAMKAGAHDYLIKDHARSYLKVLPKIISNAVNHKKLRDEVKKYHQGLEKLVKERTEQLAAEKELLSVTLSSLGEGVIVVNMERKVILFNYIAESLTGRTSEKAHGRLIDEILYFINEDNNEPMDNPVHRALESGRIEQLSSRKAILKTKDRERAVSVTAAPIRQKDGTLIGSVIVIRDVSQEREIDRMKDDFISSVSHELRTPLTSIKAYVSTILRDPEMPENTKQRFLSIVKEESNRLETLVEDLLEISRIESGRLKIKPGKINVMNVVNEIMTTIQPLANKKSIYLVTDTFDELPFLSGDESKIKSVVLNLVNNAIKFTPESGQVSVKVGRENDNLYIRVSDTGIGIPEKDLPKVFDRFYRVHRPDTQIQGTGLGLAIGGEIAKLHGGRIDVQSEIGKGSIFTLFLPIKCTTVEQTRTATDSI